MELFQTATDCLKAEVGQEYPYAVHCVQTGLVTTPHLKTCANHNAHNAYGTRFEQNMFCNCWYRLQRFARQVATTKRRSSSTKAWPW